MKRMALVLGWVLAVPLALGATPTERKVSGQTLDALSADGTVALTRAPGERISEAGAALVAVLSQRVPDETQSALLSAAGLALLSASGRAAVALPPNSYYAALTARLSRDGQVLALAAGHDGDLRALRVRAGQAPEPLLPTGQAWRSGVSAMSDDGRVVAGWLLEREQALPRGFVWQEGVGSPCCPVR